MEEAGMCSRYLPMFFLYSCASVPEQIISMRSTFVERDKSQRQLVTGDPGLRVYAVGSLIVTVSSIKPTFTR